MKTKSFPKLAVYLTHDWQNSDKNNHLHGISFFQCQILFTSHSLQGAQMSGPEEWSPTLWNKQHLEWHEFLHGCMWISDNDFRLTWNEQINKRFIILMGVWVKYTESIESFSPVGWVRLWLKNLQLSFVGKHILILNKDAICTKISKKLDQLWKWWPRSNLQHCTETKQRA